MSRPTPANVALREDILEVLRASPDRLTTEQVVVLTHTRPEGSHDRWHWRYYSTTYNQLRAMDRLGLVLWHTYGRWCAICPEFHFHWTALWEAAPYDAETGLTLADLERLSRDEP